MIVAGGGGKGKRMSQMKVVIHVASLIKDTCFPTELTTAKHPTCLWDA